MVPYGKTLTYRIFVCFMLYCLARTRKTVERGDLYAHRVSGIPAEVARASLYRRQPSGSYLSQTSLSAIVNSLEKELNIKIFQRTHCGHRATAEGEQALELAADIEKNEQLQHLFLHQPDGAANYQPGGVPLGLQLPLGLPDAGAGDEYPEIAPAQSTSSPTTASPPV